MQDGGQPPSWKMEERPYLGNGLTDWREISHGDTYLLWELYRQLQILIPKNSNMGNSRHFDNSQIAVFRSATVWPVAEKLGLKSGFSDFFLFSLF